MVSGKGDAFNGAVFCLAGLTEAGTGSTLKSSLCSLSDISDSEDISNKHI